MKPIAALPMNQKMPYPAVNRPNAAARCCAGTIGVTAAGMIDSCTPIPTPQIATSVSASQKFPKNVSGAKTETSRFRMMSTRKPYRSNRRPNNIEDVPLAAIAAE